MFLVFALFFFVFFQDIFKKKKIIVLYPNKISLIVSFERQWKTVEKSYKNMSKMKDKKYELHTYVTYCFFLYSLLFLCDNLIKSLNRVNNIKSY